MNPATYIQVYRVDLSHAEALRLVDDTGALRRALGIDVPRDRVQVIDPTALADIGLSGYLVEGEGAKSEAVSADKARLDMVKSPVLLVMPGAMARGDRIDAQAPLSHLGDYPTVEARKAGAPLRTESAEGLIAGTPPNPPKTMNDRRAGGYVAIVALAVALLVAFIMWLVAS